MLKGMSFEGVLVPSEALFQCFASLCADMGMILPQSGRESLISELSVVAARQRDLTGVFALSGVAAWSEPDLESLHMLTALLVMTNRRMSTTIQSPTRPL